MFSNSGIYPCFIRVSSVAKIPGGGRSAFTLVEILVSMALTVFLLTILAQAFVSGADTFRQMKAVGDLNDNLRTAANMLRADLFADHFEGKRRLSDGRYWADGPPQQGYFFVLSPPQPAGSPLVGPYPEGVDADNIPSYRNPGPALNANLPPGPLLAFTVKAKGNRPQDFFSLKLAAPLTALGSPNSRFQQPGTLNTQWAEVCYFLLPIQNATAGGTPLYALYRQQRLVLADVDTLNWGTPPASVPAVLFPRIVAYKNKVSCGQNPNKTPPFSNYVYFNSPADLTIPNRRTACDFTTLPNKLVPPVPFNDPTTGMPSGEDLLLMDVLSFDVKVLLVQGGDFIPVPAPGYFDTWTQRVDDMKNTFTPEILPVPNQLNVNGGQRNILAVQITLRIWSPGSRLARQVSVIVDM
jgi:type II secretory pathway pseudopilin PulG